MTCPCCGSEKNEIFYRVEDIPVHSVLLMPTREMALNFPHGDIHLTFCHDCGFIYNSAFDINNLAYSTQYEETQGFSPTFSAFQHKLAERLIDRYDLHGKTVVEIGCGKGEFLALLCELGGNRGVGFDPAYVPERLHSSAKDRLIFIQDFFTEKYAGEGYTDLRGDFYACKMTLEHIPDTLNFLSTLRRTIGDRPEAVLFFQVPDIKRILDEQAFWDIYYEHCSYFSPGALARVFRRAGFEPVDLWTDYDDQYLMIEAHPSIRSEEIPLPLEEVVAELEQRVRIFSKVVLERLSTWVGNLEDHRSKGERVAIWGGGSKAVAFLTTLKLNGLVDFVIDINPHKAGTYLPGVGMQISLPERLRENPPDVVILMNPVYCDEVRKSLRKMELLPELLAVNTASVDRQEQRL